MSKNHFFSIIVLVIAVGAVSFGGASYSSSIKELSKVELESSELKNTADKQKEIYASKLKSSSLAVESPSDAELREKMEQIYQSFAVSSDMECEYISRVESIRMDTELLESALNSTVNEREETESKWMHAQKTFDELIVNIRNLGTEHDKQWGIGRNVRESNATIAATDFYFGCEIDRLREERRKVAGQLAALRHDLSNLKFDEECLRERLTIIRATRKIYLEQLSKLQKKNDNWEANKFSR